MFSRGIALALLAAGAGVGVAPMAQPGIDLAPESFVRSRRMVRVPSSSSPRRYRSRWKATRPRKHRNRLHISRRVRRKHRRARKAA